MAVEFSYFSFSFFLSFFLPVFTYRCDRTAWAAPVTHIGMTKAPDLVSEMSQSFLCCSELCGNHEAQNQHQRLERTPQRLLHETLI